jgi:hypothetical protein
MLKYINVFGLNARRTVDILKKLAQNNLSYYCIQILDISFH